MKTQNEWLAPLMAAKLETNILRALSDLIWLQLSEEKEVTCPAANVPTGKDLWDYLAAAGEMVRNEVVAKSGAALRALYGVDVADWAQVDLSRAIFTDGPAAGKPVAASADLVAMIVSETRSTDAKRRGLANIRMETIGGVHARWVQHRTNGGSSKHPLAPLTRGYLSRPRDTPANTRRDPILPAPLIMVHKDHQQARLFSRPGHTVTRADGQAYMPGFGPGEEYGPKQPVLPLALYDLGIRNAEKRGRGAPLALRMFVEAVLSVPLLERKLDIYGFGHTVEPLTLRSILPWLYGEKGAREYRPSTHWPRLLEAFRALESHEARIPWEDTKTGQGGSMRVVTPVVIPREGRLDDYVQFSVRLPPGSELGPLIDRLALRAAGLKSAPAYRLLLGLSFLWHNPGRLIRPVGGNGPYRQVRKEELYPPVSDVELVQLAYPTGGRVTDSARRKRRYDARKALAFLEQIGFCQRNPEGGIMPGPSWAGWGTKGALPKINPRDKG